MASKFVVGGVYEPYQQEFDPITVTRRTEKTIWVDKDGVRWSMRVKTDARGNEFVADSTVPKAWREAFTYSAADRLE